MERKKGKRIGLLIVMALLVAILAGLLIWLFTMDDAPEPQDQTQAEETTAAPETQKQTEATTEAPETAEPTSAAPETTSAEETTTERETEAFSLSGVNLYSQYVVLYSLDSDTLWYDLRANDRIYPASMTKIMTALVAIEHIGDLSEKTSVSQELYDALYLEGASMAGFMPGEELTIEDMLYGALLPSGGEATAALAAYVAGSEDEFAQLMNERAAAIGMTNTHFTNASGLHDEDHYSTVYDIMLLVREAIQNEDFLRIFTTVSTHSTPTEEHPEGVWLGSSMFRYIGDRTLDGLKVLGGKTGYTDEAGNCLASLSEADGERFILVTAYGPAWSEGKPYVDDLFNIYTEVLRWKRGAAE